MISPVTGFWILDDRGHKTAEVLYGPRRREANIPASAQAVKHWTHAMRQAQEALHAAEMQYLHDLDYVVRRDRTGRTLTRASRWKDWLPLLRKRQWHRASAAYRKSTEHIRALYKPVGDTIEAWVLKRERQWMWAQHVGEEARWRHRFHEVWYALAQETRRIADQHEYQAMLDLHQRRGRSWQQVAHSLGLTSARRQRMQQRFERLRHLAERPH